ncbi:MAG TPA: CheR family methyltransferase, partial [Polyangiaceae bacterium]
MTDSRPPPEEGAPSRLGFPVVGIGASAGGLEALEALTRRLGDDRIAFVILQHLAPGHASMLGDILERGTSLPVVTVEATTRLEPGIIYVVSPNVAVSVEGEELRAAPLGDPRPRHTIDAFLRTLARSGGPMAVGVILSGTGTDGTLGLKAIKDAGGITFVQDPASASQPGMPQSAIDAGCADFSLDAAHIGDQLMRVLARPYADRAGKAPMGSAEATAKIFGQLRAAYGVDFSQYKPSTVERRIARRMALHKIETIEDYVALLGSGNDELRGLYDDLLIGVTSFFRDAEPFEALKSVVFPRLIEHRAPDVPIRVWVAGCATGEEAYSIAIALLEFLEERPGKHAVQIFATDIDDGALARARLGAYPASIELDVSPERLRRYFTRTDSGYQVSRRVRDLVVFARHSLGRDPPFSHLDLVTCRNVLIYMQSVLQKKVLRIFHYALNPDACLMLGTSESVGDSADFFSLLDGKLKIYCKKNAPVSAVVDVPFHERVAHDGELRHPDPRPVVNVAQVADRKVIEKYGPPGVIVDERLDILQFRGRTGSFLEPAPGTATLNLLKLARPEMLVALRAVTQQALAQGLPVTSSPVPVWGEQGTRTVSFDVLPLSDTVAPRCLLVLFKESTPEASPPSAQRRASTDGGNGGDGGGGEADPRLLELERELAANKEYLQAAIEELEAANEELQSSNEELQSSNEEMQSTNEELETSKE